MENTLTQERLELIREWYRETTFFHELDNPDFVLILDMIELRRNYTEHERSQLNRIRQEWIDFRNCVISNS